VRRFGVIVRGCLLRRHSRHEEARVELPRIDRRGDPVREQDERIEAKAQALLFDHRAKGEPAVVNVVAVSLETGMRVGIRQRNGGTRVAHLSLPRQQHARFLEQFPRRRNVISDRVYAVHVGQLANSVFDSIAPGRIAFPIGRVHASAGEDVRAAHERGPLVTTDHEDLGAVHRVSQNDHGRGGTRVRRDSRRHGDNISGWRCRPMTWI
jgi:hypothetical protein